MTPPFPFELNEDQPHQPFTAEPQASSLSSSFSNPIFFDHAQDQGGGNYSRELKQLLNDQDQVRDTISCD